jgi:hypothetical protein
MKQLFDRFLSGALLGFVGPRPDPKIASQISPAYKEFINIPIISPLYKFAISEYGLSPAGIAEGLGFIYPGAVFKLGSKFLKWGGGLVAPKVTEKAFEMGAKFLEENTIGKFTKIVGNRGLWEASEKVGFGAIDTLVKWTKIERLGEHLSKFLTPKGAEILGKSLRRGIVYSLPFGVWSANWDAARKRWEGEPVERTIPYYLGYIFSPTNLAFNFTLGLGAEAVSRAWKRFFEGRVSKEANDLWGNVITRDFIVSHARKVTENAYQDIENLGATGKVNEENIMKIFAKVFNYNLKEVGEISLSNMSDFIVATSIDRKNTFLENYIKKVFEQKFAQQPINLTIFEDPEAVRGIFYEAVLKNPNKTFEIFKKYGIDNYTIFQLQRVLDDFSNISKLYRKNFESIFDAILQHPGLTETLIMKNEYKVPWNNFVQQIKRNYPYIAKQKVVSSFIDNIFSTLSEDMRNQMPEINKLMLERGNFARQVNSKKNALLGLFDNVLKQGKEKNIKMLSEIWDFANPNEKEFIMREFLERAREEFNPYILFTDEEWKNIGSNLIKTGDIENLDTLARLGTSNQLILKEYLKNYHKKLIDTIPDDYKDLRNLELFTSVLGDSLRELYEKLGKKPPFTSRDIDYMTKTIVKSLTDDRLKNKIAKTVALNTIEKYHPLTNIQKESLAKDLTDLVINETKVVGKVVENAPTESVVTKFAQNIKNMRRVVPPEILNDNYKRITIMLEDPDVVISRFANEGNGAQLRKLYNQLSIDGKAGFYASLLGTPNPDWRLIGYRLWMDSLKQEGKNVSNIKMVALKEGLGIPLNKEEQEIRNQMYNFMKDNIGMDWIDYFEDLWQDQEKLRRMVREAIENGWFDLSDIDKFETMQIIKTLTENKKIQEEGQKLIKEGEDLLPE